MLNAVLLVQSQCIYVSFKRGPFLFIYAYMPVYRFVHVRVQVPTEVRRRCWIPGVVCCQTWVLGTKLRSEEQCVLAVPKPSLQLCIYLPCITEMFYQSSVTPPLGSLPLCSHHSFCICDFEGSAVSCKRKQTTFDIPYFT